MRHKYFALVAATLLACSCTTNTPKANDTDSEADTLTAAEPERIIPLEEQFLPDTIFPSVESVTFVVDHADTLPAPLKDIDDRYADSPNVMAFRKNLLRNADFGGTVEGTPDTIEVAWRFDTDNDQRETKFGRWGGGTGWSGQPVYVRWSADDMAAFRASSPGLTDDFDDEEIFIGSLCNKVYFINYKTGKPSRTPIDVTNVVKGSMSLDPELKNLYVGQGVPHSNPFGNLVIDLLAHERTQQFDRDPKAWRGWGAFDSSPIVAGGYLFWAGENGSLYKYERSQGSLRRISTLRYRVRGAAPGIESSICVYRNYGYFGDNHGNILCVNLNTMNPVWYYYNHDDTDGTIVCREEQGTPYLYTACEIDKQGTDATCYFVKLNGLTGECVWEQRIPCRQLTIGEKHFDGGMYCTPLLGTGDADGLIFANICQDSRTGNKGELLALHTADGSIAYAVPYPTWAWSSPVAFHNERREMFIFTGDSHGNAYIIRATTGEVLYRQRIGNNFESSPIVVGNTAVVGSRGNGIYKMVIRQRDTNP